MPPLVWITGASAGIGAALAASVPWRHARIIGISRRPSPHGEHLAADLADPASWPVVARSFAAELHAFTGPLAVLVHAAGTLTPIGFAGQVDSDEYTSSVMLNSAAPQVLGDAFLAASGHVARRHVVMLTSGAARKPYPGWSSYGPAKAAIDQWVRTVGAEQALSGGAQVIAVAPGLVDTAMQEQIRGASEADFPERRKFDDLYQRNELADPEEVARRIWALLDGGPATGSVVDLRDLEIKPAGPG